MTLNEDNLQIFCPTCEHENFIPFDECFVDHTISCKACNANIYWHSCPKCETGWYDLQPPPLVNCPDCSADDKKPNFRHYARNFIYFVCFMVALIVLKSLFIWMSK